MTPVDESTFRQLHDLATLLCDPNVSLICLHRNGQNKFMQVDGTIMARPPISSTTYQHVNSMISEAKTYRKVENQAFAWMAKFPGLNARQFTYPGDECIVLRNIPGWPATK